MIRRKLILINMLIIITTISALIYVTIVNMQGLFYRENAAIYDADINNVYDKVEDVVVSAQQLLVQASIDTQLQTALNDTVNLPKTAAIHQIQDRLNYYNRSSEQLSIMPYVSGTFYMLAADGSVFSSSEMPYEENDYSYHWEFRPGGEECLRVWRYIFDSDDITRCIGIVRLNLSLPAISDRFDTFGVDYVPKGKLYLLDAANNCLLPYSSHGAFSMPASLVNSLSGSSLSLREDTITVVKTLPENNWKVVAVIQGSSLLSGTKNIITMILWCGAGLLLLDLLLTWFSTSHITSPILRLSGEMPKNGHADHYNPIPVPKDATAEVKQLYDSYNQLICEVNDSLQRVKEVTKRQAEDKFLMLQAQIDPHFLYNTLNIVNCLAQNGQDDEIQEVIIALVNLFRNTLNKGQPLCTVSQEIEHLSDYLTIMKYRYPNRYQFLAEVEEDTKGLWITKQILQPLAENALLYGFVASDQKGIIKAVSRIEGSYLVLSLSNNGAPADLGMIQKLLDKDPALSAKHYGIRNVNERLISYYGEECGLNYTLQGNQTVVTLKLPLAKLNIPKESFNEQN